MTETQADIPIPNEKLTDEAILQLYNARKRLQKLLQALPDPVLAFNLDKSVEFINPAFEQVFGWTLSEIKGKDIKFIPEKLVKQARKAMKHLYQHGSIHDFETRRYTKDGRLLDILINGSMLYDDDNQPMGQALILRDMTQEKRMAKINQVMFKISRELHQYQKLGDLIAVISKEIQELLGVEGAFVILANEALNELYFYSAHYHDSVSDTEIRKIRFPADEGVSGRVYQTGEPLIVDDMTNCPFLLKDIDKKTDLYTKNIMSVPIRLKGKTIGVVTVVNKLLGTFDSSDSDLLSMVGGTVALPIENTRIHEELRNSYRDLQGINQAKDKVINHLAHELKTPASVLMAAMSLMGKKLQNMGLQNEGIDKIIARAQRNLERILDLQYEVEDLLREKDFKSHHLLGRLVDACRDELMVLVENQTENMQVIDSVRQTIDKLFGPQDRISEVIGLGKYMEKRIQQLQSKFSDRQIDLAVRINPTGAIHMPLDILDIITGGIIRNAVEYTPDAGRIEITLKDSKSGPVLTVKDYGIGITDEKLHLMFENYFTPPESKDYSTKTPFAFYAGGRGFDLLRIKLFSERYSFAMDINSTRCPVIPNESDLCPGDIQECGACKSVEDCMKSGGTTVVVRFDTTQESGSPA